MKNNTIKIATTALAVLCVALLLMYINGAIQDGKSKIETLTPTTASDTIIDEPDNLDGEFPFDLSMFTANMNELGVKLDLIQLDDRGYGQEINHVRVLVECKESEKKIDNIGLSASSQIENAMETMMQFFEAIIYSMYSDGPHEKYEIIISNIDLENPTAQGTIFVFDGMSYRLYIDEQTSLVWIIIKATGLPASQDGRANEALRTMPVEEPTTTTTTTATTTEPGTTTAPSTDNTSTTATLIYPFIVYWGHTGDKVHLNPNCRTITNGVLSGTLAECKAAGHTEGWCQVCSYGMTDELFYKYGNKFAQP